MEIFTEDENVYVSKFSVTGRDGYTRPSDRDYMGIRPIWGITLHPSLYAIVVRDLQSCISGFRAGCRVCCDLKRCELRLLLTFLFAYVHRSRLGVLHRFQGIDPEAW